MPEQRTIPVYTKTRNKCREAKGSESYDQFIDRLVDDYAERND